jgi:hypothetical protein
MRIELQVGDNEYEKHIMCFSNFISSIGRFNLNVRVFFISQNLQAKFSFLTPLEFSGFRGITN